MCGFGLASIEVGRRHECRRCTQECVRHTDLLSGFALRNRSVHFSDTDGFGDSQELED